MALGLGRRLETRLRAAFLRKIPRLTDRYLQSRPSSDMAERAHSAHQIRELPHLGAQFAPSNVRARADDDRHRVALSRCRRHRRGCGRDDAGHPRGRTAVAARARPAPADAHGSAHPLLPRRVPWADSGQSARRRALARPRAGGAARRMGPRRPRAAENGRHRQRRAARRRVRVRRVAAPGARAVRRRGRRCAPPRLLGAQHSAARTGDRADRVAIPDPAQPRAASPRAARRARGDRTGGHVSVEPAAAASRGGLRIDLDAVTVRAGGHTILEDASIAIEPGAHVAIVGPVGRREIHARGTPARMASPLDWRGAHRRTAARRRGHRRAASGDRLGRSGRPDLEPIARREPRVRQQQRGRALPPASRKPTSAVSSSSFPRVCRRCSARAGRSCRAGRVSGCGSGGGSAGRMRAWSSSTSRSAGSNAAGGRRSCAGHASNGRAPRSSA